MLDTKHKIQYLGKTKAAAGQDLRSEHMQVADGPHKKPILEWQLEQPQAAASMVRMLAPAAMA